MTERAVENIKQEKATGEQWLKMIEKNGGLKKEEDKWMGLSDFLKDKKSLTKQEVLDFIRENQVKVEEVEYGNGGINALQEEYDELIKEHDGNWEDAWDEMIDRYGDDIDMAIDGTGGRIQVNDGFEDYLETINGTRGINSTRLGYTTEGLDNKKEIALTVPTIESWNESDEIHFGDAGNGRAVAWVRFGETEGVPNGVDADRYHDYSRKMKEAISRRDEMVEQLKRYKGGMLTETQKRLEEEEAYIQQLRERYKDVADVKPSRVLVIDEIQSKRHQEGREKGYKNPTEKGYKNPTVYKDATIGEYHKTSYGEEADIIGANGNKIGTMTKDADGYYATDNDGDNMTSTRNTEAEALQAMDNAFSGSGIPDAPFQKNWHELAMKRMLRYAAENGYDKVAWTKGEQQADRYSLAKTIPSITRQDTKKAADKGIKVFAMDINGEPEKIFVDNDGTITNTTLFMDEVSGKPLSDFVGKDIAIRMMSMNDGETIDTSKEKVGGEGMKGFYDMMLPRFMDKYGKKWGVKTGEVELPNVEEAGRTMWSVDVTPEMKDSVMEGQTMFRVADDIKKAQMDIISKNNPADESLGEHTWIKSVDDIKTFDEAMTEYGENENLTPDYTADMARKAKETGKITVYSSKPIDNGIFVTPSKMEAKNYAGEGEVYSKKVRTSDVAWIDGIQGQYAKVEGSQPRFRVADDITPEEAEEASTQFRVVDDPEEIERLEKEPKIKVYRAMQLRDGKLYPPMAAKVNGKWQDPLPMGEWSQADEHPELVDKNGKFTLDKGNGKKVAGVVYAPYMHGSTTMLNDQFKEAQDRPELVVVEAEMPESELTSGYQADKSPRKTGAIPWKAGTIQGQLTGTREVILSRWVKPVRIVPASEVAANIKEMIDGQVDVMPTNVVTPEVRQELEKLGVQFVKTNNQEIVMEGEHKGEQYSDAYGLNAKRKEKKARKKAKKNEGEVRFSKEEPKYIDPRNMPYKDRKRRGDELRTISAIEVKPNQIVSKEGKSARKVAEEWWDTNVGEPHWYDTEVGKVEINRNTVESSLAHRYGQKKLDAITSLVDGFKNAVYLGTLKDADRRATFNHFFAYPILYNGKRCYVFCRALHDNNTNRLYIHEVFVGENIKKGNTLQTAAFKPHGGIALYRDILANVLDSDSKDNTNISNTQEKSEENDKISFRITPEEDAEYMDAVEKRDIKKARQMVKAAAKKAMPETKVVDEDGEPLVVYHGTDLEQVNGGEPFYTFYEDSHFGTWGQAEGRLYGRNAYFIRKNPKIYEVYLNLKNPKRVPDVPIDWEATHSEYWEQAIKQAKEEGYDGIVYKNEWEGEGDSYIAFNPNQIKSADPVTYDDNGKVIPLSERFNEENDDIRFRVSDERRRREYAERQWKRAHNKAANTIKALGISDNVTVVDTPEELAGYDSMTEQQKASKGWYDENTGNIVVIVGNHTSPEDVQRTILREGVARYGLRQLFGQNYNNFLDNVLTNAETGIRREIVNIATRNGYDFRKATEEYLARLANDTDFERAMKQGWWSQIKSYFLDMLHSIGLADWIEDDLSDNELRYMLWRSYMNLTEPNARRNPFNRAREISMRDNLKVGDYSNIEDELPVGNFDYVAEQRIRKLVSEMPMSEVRKAYEAYGEGARRLAQRAWKRRHR